MITIGASRPHVGQNVALAIMPRNETWRPPVFATSSLGFGLASGPTQPAIATTTHSERLPTR